MLRRQPLQRLAALACLLALAAPVGGQLITDDSAEAAEKIVKAVQGKVKNAN